MFERLLELFFHAKAGLIAGVLVVGTTGALVTATVQNGVTTITITSPSASPTAETTTETSPSATPTASPAGTARVIVISNSQPVTEPGTSGNSCDTTAAASAKAEKKRVNDAYSQFHTDLMHLRDAKRGEAKDIVKDADRDLKAIRKAAVKALHEMAKCDKFDDEDDDQDVDEDVNDDTDNDNDQSDDRDEHKSRKDDERSGREDNFFVAIFANVQRFFGGHTASHGSTTVTFTVTTDPKTTADNAIAAMQLVFDNAKAELDALPTPTPKAKEKEKDTRTPEAKRTDRTFNGANNDGNDRGRGSDDRGGNDRGGKGGGRG